VLRQIRQLAIEEKNVKLQSSGGVLLFEGMQVNDIDDFSMREMRGEDGDDDEMLETDFVDAPKYDPVKSGFYSKKQKNKNYYDSDDDEDGGVNKNRVVAAPAATGMSGFMDMFTKSISKSSSRDTASTSGSSAPGAGAGAAAQEPEIQSSIEVVINKNSALNRW